MRKSAIILCMSFIVFCSSCGWNSHSAQEFYGKMTAINDTLDLLTSTWHDQLNKATIDKNYSALTPIRIELGAFIARSRAALPGLEQNDETEKILAKESTLLETRSSVVAEIYPNFDNLTEFTPNAEMSKNMTAVLNDLREEKAAVAEVNKMLQAIAVKYKLKR